MLKKEKKKKKKKAYRQELRHKFRPKAPQEEWMSGNEGVGRERRKKEKKRQETLFGSQFDSRCTRQHCKWQQNQPYCSPKGWFHVENIKAEPRIDKEEPIYNHAAEKQGLESLLCFFLCIKTCMPFSGLTHLHKTWSEDVGVKTLLDWHSLTLQLSGWLISPSSVTGLRASGDANNSRAALQPV